MKLSDLNIDVAIAELLAMGKAEYPADHKAGMEVPEGGSNCAKCKYVRADDKECANKYFQQWHGSNKLPMAATIYCCDWFEAKSDLQAYGTSEGVRKEWESRIRNAHGISVDIFNRYNRTNPDAISVNTFLDHKPPSMAEREKLAKAFLEAKGPTDEDLPIDSLIPLQNTVFKDKVEAIRSEGMYRNPIDVFRYQGKNYVMDGHHRLAVWSMDQHDTIPAHIYQIPGDKRDLNAGGPGSGCNPEAGKCGRPSQEDNEQQAHDQLDALRNWQGGSHWIRMAANDIIQGQKPDKPQYWPQAYKDAGVILDLLHNGREIEQPIFRGLPAAEDHPALKLKVGDETQLGLTSFTMHEQESHNFAYPTNDTDIPVIFQTDGPTKVTDVTQAIGEGEHGEYPGEAEIISDGKFKVTAVEDVKGYGSKMMFHKIHIQQEGIL